MANVLSDDELKKLTCPILLLIGDNSPYPAEKVVSRAKRVLPDVTAEIVSHASHTLMVEDAELINQRIQIFLNRLKRNEGHAKGYGHAYVGSKIHG